MGANKRLGRWLLYGLCLAPAVIMLCYYWLEYIPRARIVHALLAAGLVNFWSTRRCRRIPSLEAPTGRDAA